MSTAASTGSVTGQTVPLAWETVAREDRKKKSSGRTTPKGGIPAGARHAISKGHAHGEVADTGSGRYTAPVPQQFKVSPPWVPVLMFTLLGLGAVVIFLNYLGLLPGATDNKYLLLGLAFILGGIITSTQFH